MNAAVKGAARVPGFLQGAMLLLCVTMAVMGVIVLTPVIPAMEAHFRPVPYHQYLVPIMMTAPSLWILAFSPAAGWLADRCGRRPLMLWAMLLYAVVGTMPTYLDSIRWILLSRCGVGICESIVVTVTTTMISDYFKGASRQKWLAAQTAIASLSALVIVPLGGILGSAFGWRGPFYLYGYTLLLAVGVYLFTWEPERTDPLMEQASEAQDAIYHRVPWVRLLSLCGLTLVASVSFYSIITQNGNALAALGVNDPAKIGLFTEVSSIGVPVGTFLYSRVAPRWHISHLLFVDYVLIGAGFWLMGHAHGVGQYTAYGFINQLGCGMVLPTMLVWTTSGLAYEIRGFGNGLWQGAFAVGQFITAVLLPFLTLRLGALSSTFKLLGVFALVTALGALIGRRSPSD